MHYCLKDIVVETHIGITPEERGATQTLLFRVAFDFEATPASETDDLADTVDYQKCYDTIKTVASGGEWNLLESLHAELFQALKKTCPEAENLKLFIEKSPWKNGSITVN